jgi:hypothetical protein
MAPRTGRPPIPEDQRRSKTLMIRLTAAEAETLKAAGGSEWARGVLLRASKRKT